MKVHCSVLAMVALFLVDVSRAALFDSPDEDCQMLESVALGLAMPPADTYSNRPQECV
jgi:hypothetical protein